MKPEETVQGRALSALQCKLWRWQEGAGAERPSYVSCVFEIVGGRPAADLADGLRAAIERSAILNVVFRRLAGLETPLQVVATEPVSVALFDLSGLDPAAQRNRIAAETRPESVDAERGPMVAAVFACAEDRAVIHISCHPLIGDLETLIGLARSVLRGSVDNDAPSFLDVAAEHGAMIRRGELNEESEFWAARRRGATTRLRLPFERAAAVGGTWAVRSLSLEAEQRRLLADLCRDRRSSPGEAVYASLRALLARVCDAQEIEIGVSSDARELLGLTALPGPLTETLPHDDVVDPGADFVRSIDDSSTAISRLRQNQGYVPDRRAESILVCFDEQTLPDNESCGGSSLTARDAVVCRWDAPLRLILRNGSVLEAQFDAGRFDEAAVEFFLKRWRGFLEQALRRPSSPLADHELLMDGEKERVLFQHNRTDAPFPPESVVALVLDQASRVPKAVAARFLGEEMSYDDLRRQAGALAGRLGAEGLGRGDIVSIYMEPGFEMLVSVLAVLGAGAAYVPLDPDDPPARSSYMHEDSRARLVLTQSHLVGRAPGGVGGQRVVQLPLVGAPAFRSDIAGDDIAYVLYTSGSTGRPKGAMITHRGLSNYLAWVNDALYDDRVRTIPFLTKLTFDACLKQMLAPLIRGGEVWVQPKDTASQPSLLLDALASRPNLGLNCVPSLWSALLEEISSIEGFPVGNIQGLYLGGEALDRALVDRTIERFPHVRIRNLYGPTETTANASSAVIGVGDPITIGHPIANTKIYILDPRMRPVSVGTPGEIFIGGVGVAAGYVGRPELTAERFLKDPFSADRVARMYRSGDRGVFREDGSIEYLGRLDDQVKLRGHRVELGEIKVAIGAFPGVRECAVAVIREEGRETQLIAYLARPAPTDLAGLREHLAEKLPRHMLPDRFIEIVELPRLSNGKLDGRKLGDPEYLRSLPVSIHVAPRTPEEEQVAAIWQRILNLDRISVEDSLFAVGGHSLAAARIVNEVNKHFGVKIALQGFIASSTIAGLARLVSRSRDRGHKDAKPGLFIPFRTAGGRPPIILVHPITGTAYRYFDFAQALPADQPIYGVQATAVADAGAEPQTRVEAMARAYLDELSELSPRGPWILAGWSFGGTIAFEMARVLEAGGKPAAHLLLIEAGAPALMRERRSPEDLEEVPMLLELFGREFPLDRDALDAVPTLPERLKIILSCGRAAGLISTEVSGQDLFAQFRVFRSNVTASAAYQPQGTLSKTPATLLRGRERALWGDAPDDLRWSEVLGGPPEFHWIEGGHFTVFAQRHAQQLAERVRAALAEAEV